MIQPGDLYTQYIEEPIKVGTAEYGTASFRYEIRQLVDVRNLESVISYRIMCTHRISIPNTNAFSLTPSTITTYNSYPGLFRLTTTCQPVGGNTPRLMDYNPRTLNTTVMTSANHNDGTSESNSRQHTTGSSVAQTNSYDANVSLGFFGDVPTGSIGGGYSHSTTRTKETSDSTGSQSGTSSEQASGESMSIKDWGSYAYLDETRTHPAWIWGQEYPWDIIQFRSCDAGGNTVDLPQFIKDRLFATDPKTNNVVVCPPSQLSLFGIDVIMKATWIVALPKDMSAQTLQLNHELDYITASHGLDGATQYARLDPAPATFPVKSPPLDLTLLGLDPVLNGAADNGAVVGFSADRFIVPPSQGAPFKALSGTNNLQVTGSGFEAGMSTNFSHGGEAKFRLQFKVIDDVYNYSLFLKHWIVGTTGCTLTVVCNGDTANEMICHVDDAEGAGGENNLLELNLRNKDYASINYHDYLVLGTNTIDITVSPNDQGAVYQLRAIAIGES